MYNIKLVTAFRKSDNPNVFFSRFKLVDDFCVITSTVSGRQNGSTRLALDQTFRISLKQISERF